MKRPGRLLCACAALASLRLAGCGGKTPQPAITVDPPTISFTAPEGGPNPASWDADVLNSRFIAKQLDSTVKLLTLINKHETMQRLFDDITYPVGTMANGIKQNLLLK